MRTRLVGLAALGAAVVVTAFGGLTIAAQQGQSPAAPPRNPSPANMPLTTLEDVFVRFPLPPGQEAYADIDGRHMHQYVVEQANIARRYRDAGHPKFWGRIIGTSADVEDEYHHYFHTDLETPQTVPWTGLEASARAYAKIIDEVNRLPLSTFQRQEERQPTAEPPSPPIARKPQ